MRRAASITSVPGGTVTSRSSIFSVMSFESAILSRDPQRTAAMTSAGLYGHFPERCSSNSCRHFLTMLMVGIAAASPSGQNVLPSMFFARSPTKVMSSGAPDAGMETVQHLAQPARAFAAGNAPAAGFVRVEMHDAPRQIHHAGVFVDHDEAARAQHRAGLGHGIVIHVDVNFLGRQQRAGTAAGNHGLELSCRSACRRRRLR